MPSAVFGQRKLRLTPTDLLRIHDFIGLAMFQNTILMNAGSVRKRIFADDGFASRDGQSAHPTHNPRSLHYLRGLKIGEVVAVEVLSSIDCHHDFFQSNVTCPLTDTVDGSLHLTGAAADRGQPIGYGYSQFIVAINPNHLCVNMPTLRL